MSNKKNVLYFVRIIGILLLITMLTAALLSLVNIITKDKIAENDRLATERAIKELFDQKSGLTVTKHTVEVSDKAYNGFYEVKEGDTLLGYYADVSPRGYMDAVNMLVALNPDGSVKAITVLKNSETPGIGSKAMERSFLETFKGIKDSGSSVDAISGATYSSAAVINGVDLALTVYKSYKGV